MTIEHHDFYVPVCSLCGWRGAERPALATAQHALLTHYADRHPAQNPDTRPTPAAPGRTGTGQHLGTVEGVTSVSVPPEAV